MHERPPRLLASLFGRDGTEGELLAHWHWNDRPARWTRRIVEDAIGRDGLRTICVRRSGEGRSGVSWTADLPGDGFYDVYARIFLDAFINMNMSPSERAPLVHPRFVVRHDGGEAAVSPPLSRPENLAGEWELWVHLGAWRFAAGPARVELSDACEGPTVAADAVKWVRR